MDTLIKKILDDTQATEFQCYLTASHDKTAFRKQIYPEYKANRKAPRPVHYEALREFLVNDYGASISTIIEADDAIGIDCAADNSTVVVSIDKDLLQLPGLNYNFVKEKFTEVNQHSGLRSFYKQLLMGDKADNIKGVEGIGEIKAERILNSADDYCEEEWFDVVRQTYNNDMEMHKNGVCLWLLREFYPQGTWSYHPFGSILIPEMEREQLYLVKQNANTLDVSTQETSMDGKSQSGTNLVEITRKQEQVQV